MKQINFYETKKPWGFCSNFYKGKPIKIDGDIWDTVEHYFQAMKFRGPQETKESLEYSKLIQIADCRLQILQAR